ncbi:hypothetical protein OH77DRAFT_1425317 [Trametes cingulata]|nr:hypothetical protein OH77DRAFT_1425317 [Trametes cingulata]
MSLFTGRAWFSPGVPVSVRKAWATHGGSVAGVHAEDEAQATYLFCDGNDDPWFAKLYQRSVAVFHWLWISAVVNARFRVPISAYAIDATTDPGEADFSVPAYMRIQSPKTPTSHMHMHKHPKQLHQVLGAMHTRSVRIRLSVSPERVDDDLSEPGSPIPKTRREKQSTPFVDLRSLQMTRKASHRRRSKTVRLLASSNTEQREQQTLPSRTQEDAPTFSALVSAAASGLSVKPISVSAALDALAAVSTEHATQFVPGTLHLGKEFRCFYVQ